MNSTHFKAILAAAAATAALTACGGGGHGHREEPNVPPASASQSSQGFLAYIAGLANRFWDDAEPRDLSNFTPPSENTDAQEPVAVAGDV